MKPVQADTRIWRNHMRINSIKRFNLEKIMRLGKALRQGLL